MNAKNELKEESMGSTNPPGDAGVVRWRGVVLVRLHETEVANAGLLTILVVLRHRCSEFFFHVVSPSHLLYIATPCQNLHVPCLKLDMDDYPN